ncbi:MAG: M20/M25/M40 family metallo-hydrolase [Xanthomonadales bacterium]|nr:M20/M25/M40 family metallo-hydrolase [Gammaproteobacteria bacterium]NND57861.1 M20/M25/M40 family metallo-hydrolase [Xanthomonadales bacterium]
MRFMHHFLLLCFLLSTFAGNSAQAQMPADPMVAAGQAREWRQAHEQEIIDGFAELLRLPNVASDGINIRRNAEYIRSLLTPRGFNVRLLESEGSPPAVFAERKTSGAVRTLMIYVHYDGQPVNAAEWASDPWTPTMRDAPVELGGKIMPMKAPFDPEWRLFARSAGDDKAPIIALNAALDAMAAAGLDLSVNLKLFFEGEEEAGSPHLKQMLSQHRALLDADLWLFCDGPVHQSRRWLLSYGVRGSFGFGLTVFGPNRPLHSGHYGNWAPNPIARLTRLLDTMRDEQGNILIDGFDDQVVPPSLLEMAAIEAAPPVDETLVGQFGIGRPENAERIELAVMRPAINFRGIRSGDVGEKARNSIQTSATASVGLRLVPAQTPDYLRQVIERHVREQGYLVVHQPPTAGQRAAHDRIALLDWSESGYPAYRAPFDLPMAQEVAGIMQQLSDQPLVQLPTMGGSLPLYLIDEVVGAPILILPVANHDNNQHGKNENLRLQNLWDAIEIYAAVLTGL